MLDGGWHLQLKSADSKLNEMEMAQQPQFSMDESCNDEEAREVKEGNLLSHTSGSGVAGSDGRIRRAPATPDGDGNDNKISEEAESRQQEQHHECRPVAVPLDVSLDRESGARGGPRRSTAPSIVVDILPARLVRVSTHQDGVTSGREGGCFSRGDGGDSWPRETDHRTSSPARDRSQQQSRKRGINSDICGTNSLRRSASSWTRASNGSRPAAGDGPDLRSSPLRGPLPPSSPPTRDNSKGNDETLSSNIGVCANPIPETPNNPATVICASTRKLISNNSGSSSFGSPSIRPYPFGRLKSALRPPSNLSLIGLSVPRSASGPDETDSARGVGDSGIPNGASVTGVDGSEKRGGGDGGGHDTNGGRHSLTPKPPAAPLAARAGTSAGGGPLSHALPSVSPILPLPPPHAHPHFGGGGSGTGSLSGLRDLDGCVVWYTDDSAAEADIESMASVASVDSREVRAQSSDKLTIQRIN